MKPWAKQTGFTIVELLIVIVVIGILAAITIVAYNGIQQRGRDAQRKSDLVQIAKALELYRVDKGGYPSSTTGCASGSNGGGMGWLNYDNGTATYPKRVITCLIEGGYLARELIDPSGARSCSANDGCRAYMIYVCAGGTWLYANLESEPQSSTATDNACGVSWDTSFGINYVVRVS
jgi:prepilin-type N-terminal cleavage/methylation domain-containing protein